MPDDMEEGAEAEQAETELQDGLEKARLLVEQAKAWLTGTAGSKA